MPQCNTDTGDWLPTQYTEDGWQCVYTDTGGYLDGPKWLDPGILGQGGTLTPEMCLSLRSAAIGESCDLTGSPVLPDLHLAAPNPACTTFMSADCVKCGAGDVCSPPFESNADGHGVCKLSGTFTDAQLAAVGDSIQSYRWGEFQAQVIDKCDFSALDQACQYEVDDLTAFCDSLCAGWSAAFVAQCVDSQFLELLQTKLTACVGGDAGKSTPNQPKY